MRFLFFDLECACVSKVAAHILSFGYVLTDENFKILSMEDILINPCCKIRTHDKSGDGIVLPYDEATLKKQPKFRQIYPRLKAMLEDPENVAIGHATTNDARYLNLDTSRLKLPPLKFPFYDTQILYAERIKNYNELRGLPALATEFGINATAHCSMDDAMVTLSVLQKMCEAEGKTFFEWQKAIGGEPGWVKNYECTTATTEGYRVVLRERQKRKEERRLAWERKMKAEQKARKKADGFKK